MQSPASQSGAFSHGSVPSGAFESRAGTFASAQAPPETGFGMSASIGLRAPPGTGVGMSGSTCLESEVALSLESFRNHQDNLECADCGAAKPEWGSLQDGTLVCLYCAGVHRCLALKTKSLTRPELWTAAEASAICSQGGNLSANRRLAELAGLAAPRPPPDADRTCTYGHFNGSSACHFFLTFAMLCFAICARLCYAILCYVCYAMLRYVMQHA